MDRNNIKVDKRLHICKTTRESASRSLYDVLSNLLSKDEPISEKVLRDKWLEDMRKNKEIYEDGWYNPPEHGMGVIFGADQDSEKSRLNHNSLRNMVPSDNIYLDRDKGIVYVYAGPVDRESGIIGDFGMTLYFGKNSEIINHLKSCYALNKDIFEFMDTGKSFEDIYEHSDNILKQRSLTNDVHCVTDSSATTTFGHTVPASYEHWTDTELQAFKTGSWNQIKDAINYKRKYIKPGEKLEIKPGMAITIEPRPQIIDRPDIPMLSFHNIAVFHEDGTKELLMNFNEIFRISGMDYMQ